MTIGERIDAAKDKIKGKTNEIVGDARGDKEQEMKGRMQRIKGDVKDVKTDIKEAYKDD